MSEYDDHRMATQSREWLIVAVIVTVAVVGVSSAAYAMYSFNRAHPGYPQGGVANGSSGMWGMMQGLNFLTQSQLDSLPASKPTFVANNTLTFSGGSVWIVVQSGPMGEGQNMYSFVIDNLTNPTLIVPQGARVTLTVVNVDTDSYHGLTLTSYSQPYAYNIMPLMMGSLASTAAMPPSASGYASQQISFTVSGATYYICPVPGHAQAGMYGLIRPG